MRQGYGRPQPNWNDQFESRFRYRGGLRVKIANAYGGRPPQGGRARETIVDEALAGLVEPLPAAKKATVLVHDDHFHPASLTVARGAVVTWRWVGENQHDLRFRRSRGLPRVAASRARTTGSVRRTFRKRGKYRHLCTLHAGMTGRVRVR